MRNICLTNLYFGILMQKLSVQFILHCQFIVKLTVWPEVCGHLTIYGLPVPRALIWG